MNRFYLVNFFFPDGPPRIRDLEPVFYRSAGDWIRFSPHSWIVWTHKYSGEIYDDLRSSLGYYDQVLITPIDFDNALGHIAPWIWGWLISKDPTIANLLDPAAAHNASLQWQQKLLPPP